MLSLAETPCTEELLGHKLALYVSLMMSTSRRAKPSTWDICKAAKSLHKLLSEQCYAGASNVVISTSQHYCRLLA